MNKFTALIIILILGAFGGFVAWSTINAQKNTAPDYSTYDTSKLIAGNDDENGNGGIADHVRGKEDSEVVVIEYADFQCPGCAGMMSHVDNLYKKYGDRVAFAFRNFPLTMHANARAASAAAEAAGLQGYYWEMYETLFTNQNSWGEKTGEARTSAFVELFAGIAKDGDVEKFRNDLSNENIKKKIDFDYNLGKEIDKVSATPSIYVNGELVELVSGMTFDDVEDAAGQLIEEKLAKTSKETIEETSEE